jgi:hypothetical protein
MPAPVAQAQVKLTDLVRDRPKDGRDGTRIQGRAVSRDRVDAQAALI